MVQKSRQKDFLYVLIKNDPKASQIGWYHEQTTCYHIYSVINS